MQRSFLFRPAVDVSTQDVAMWDSATSTPSYSSPLLVELERPGASPHAMQGLDLPPIDLHDCASFETHSLVDKLSPGAPSSEHAHSSPSTLPPHP